METIDINIYKETMLRNDTTAFEVLRDRSTGKQTTDVIEWVVSETKEFRYEDINRFAPQLGIIADGIINDYIPRAGTTFIVKRDSALLKFEFTPPIDPLMVTNPLQKLDLVPISEWSLVSLPLNIEIGHSDVNLQLQLTSFFIEDWRGFYMQSIANFTATLPNQDELAFQIRWGCNNLS